MFSSSQEMIDGGVLVEIQAREYRSTWLLAKQMQNGCGCSLSDALSHRHFGVLLARFGSADISWTSSTLWSTPPLNHDGTSEGYRPPQDPEASGCVAASSKSQDLD